MKKSNLLINEPPLQVSPTLAALIGLNEAIAIQQLHYWICNPKCQGEIDPAGNKWIYNTYEEWQEGNFPFWSTQTIQRIFLNLEKTGVVIAAQLNAKRRDMRKYYRIAYDVLDALDSVNLIPSNPSTLDDVKMNQRLHTETTADIKLTTEELAQANAKVDAILRQGINPLVEKEREAINAFESAFGITRPWDWYPAKTSDEAKWREFRTYVLELYEADRDCFTKYFTWSNTPYMKGTMTGLGIKRNPQDFPDSWAAYCASAMYNSKAPPPKSTQPKAFDGVRQFLESLMPEEVVDGYTG